MSALIIIPARMGSTRLPGKPLLAETGKPLIQHTVETAQLVTGARVVVATDDERIVDAVEGFSGEAVLTSPDHQSGSDRVAEAARLVGGTHDVIVNVQGDEPELDPAAIDLLITTHRSAKPNAFVSTLACAFPTPEQADDPNAVKAVLSQPNQDGLRYAMYFSRARAPFPRTGQGRPYLHVGIYAFSPDTLQQFPKLPRTPLEQTESLEQLRVLEHGHAIAVAEIDHAVPGIDTPEDYAAFVKRMNARR